MQRTGASFLLPFQISGFTEITASRIWHLAPLAQRGFFFTHADSCHGNLCLSEDPPKWIQLPCQQISAYKRPATLGRNLASPKACELNHKDAYLSSSSHVGKVGSSPISFQSLRQQASPPPPELGVAGGCVTEEQTGYVCASDTWAMANCGNHQNSAGSLTPTWQPHNNFHCLIIRQKYNLVFLLFNLVVAGCSRAAGNQGKGTLPREKQDRAASRCRQFPFLNSFVSRGLNLAEIRSIKSVF